MKAIWNSFRQMVIYVKNDFMLYMALSFTFIMGVLFKFGMPAFDGLLSNVFGVATVLEPYYHLFDIIFPAFGPYMFTYVAGMVVLEDIDDHIANYMFISPLGSKGYVVSHFLLPAILGGIMSAVVRPIFALTELPTGQVIYLIVIWTIYGFVLEMLMISASTNKMEGLVITRVEMVSLLAYLIPFFMESKVQYLFAFLPSWWVGKSLRTGNPVIYAVSFAVTLIWAAALYRLFKKRVLH